MEINLKNLYVDIGALRVKDSSVLRMDCRKHMFNCVWNYSSCKLRSNSKGDAVQPEENLLNSWEDVLPKFSSKSCL